VRPTDWLASNVPEGKWGARLDLVPQGLPFVGTVRSYVENLQANVEAGRGLILWGPYRGGKSCLAAVIVGEALAYRLYSYWVESFDVADAWIGKAKGRREAIRGAGLLVVDDLGMESKGSSDWPKDIMHDLMRYRLERLRPTIITTNMSTAEIQKVYGEKMWALLQEYMSDVLVKGAEDHWRKR
jgi:DNA replication protein DnaC